VTTEAVLLDEGNKVQPDLYTACLPDLLEIKEAVAA